MTRRIDPAEYALGLLEGADLAAGATPRGEDPAFAAEVRALTRRRRAAGRARGRRVGRRPARRRCAWTPGPGARARPAAALRGRAGLRERLGAGLSVRPALAAACAVVLLGIGVGAGLLVAGGDDGGPAPAGQVVALDRFGDGPLGASGRATVSQIAAAGPRSRSTRAACGRARRARATRSG